MTEQLIYTIAGENYILVEIPFIEGKTHEAREFCEKHGMVFQGIKEVKRSLLGAGYTIARYLLPERNFKAYSQDKSYKG